MKTSMYVDLFRLTLDYDAPANVLILTGDDNLARPVESLKIGGSKVFGYTLMDAEVAWRIW